MVYSGSQIRQWRQEKKWSMRKFRDVSGVPLTTISDVETEKATPNILLYMKLLNALGKELKIVDK